MVRTPSFKTSVYALIGAFFDRSLYRAAAFSWQGIAFHLLILLTIIGGIPGLLQSTRYTEIIKQEALHVITQLPPLLIENGTIITTVTPAIPLYNSDNKQVGILDTRGEAAITPGSLLFVISADRLTFFFNHDYQKTIDFREFKDGSVLSEQLQRSVMHLYAQVRLFLPVILLSSYCLILLFKGLIFALLAKAMGYFLALKLPFSSLYRIALLAITPMLIPGIIMPFLSISFIQSHIFLYVISLFYIYFGLASCRDSEKTSPQHL